MRARSRKRPKEIAAMDDAMPTPERPSAAAPPSDEFDWTGQVLGQFRLLHRLGHGGMGQVYLAEQISLKRKVALKLLQPGAGRQRTCPAPLQGRGGKRRPRHPRQHRPGLRPSARTTASTTWPSNTSKAETCASSSKRRGPPNCRSACASCGRSRRPCSGPASWASSIATSSPKTSCSLARAK